MPLKLQVNALYFNFIRTVILFMFYNSSPTGTSEVSEPGERKLALKIWREMQNQQASRKVDFALCYILTQLLKQSGQLTEYCCQKFILCNCLRNLLRHCYCE